MAENDFVLLESADGYTFLVTRKVACASGMLKSMLDEDGQFSGNSYLIALGPADALAAAFEESKNKTCKIQQRFAHLRIFDILTSS